MVFLCVLGSRSLAVGPLFAICESPSGSTAAGAGRLSMANVLCVEADLGSLGLRKILTSTLGTLVA
jgi:hypothetical protein